MVHPAPKRLIEVDLPIARISAYARAEKDSRLGHIPRIHIYPAARPLAACRAVLLATLLPDPADPRTPAGFVSAAARILSRFRDERGGKPRDWSNPLQIREALLDFVAEAAAWEHSLEPAFLTPARNLIEAAHQCLAPGPGRPLVVDPFAGGGAIPVESLRLGADAFASDLNPLAVMLNRVMLQYVPTYGERLIDALLEWQDLAREAAKNSLSKFYPAGGDGAVPIAYLWARTVLSEAPDESGVPVEIPMIRSMWLSRKGKKRALRWYRDSAGRVLTEVADVSYADGQTRRVRRPLLEIFEPRSDREVEKGTVARNSATCPVTGVTTPAARVRLQLERRKGGAADSRLYCVVSVHSSVDGRIYREPSAIDLEAFSNAAREIERRSRAHGEQLPLVPDEHLPIMSGVFNAPIYGHSTWGSLFNQRQLLALTTYAELARDYAAKVSREDPQYGRAVAALLGLIIDRLADLNASLCVWQLSTPNTAHVFGRWALPMIMDYGEVNPLAAAGGSPESAIRRAIACIRDFAPVMPRTGDVRQSSATGVPLPDDAVDVLFTDPPYYNAVPYADLSDFFHVWLRRSVGEFFPDLFSQDLSPKDDEICEMAGWDPDRYANKDKRFFEERMKRALADARRYVKPDGIGVVVFAHKTTAGWEAMLSALIEAGWIITASWPVDTEMASRLRAKNSAALASSVHIVCRPREDASGAVLDDLVGDWRDVQVELPQRIREWMPRLASEGIAGADAIFACLGPALEVFSRYSRVEKSSGERVALAEYLEHVWAAVASEALSMIFEGADAAGLEADARLTAMWLWTIGAGRQAPSYGEPDGADEQVAADDEEESSSGGRGALGGFGLDFDAARKIAQGLGAHLEALGRLVEVRGDTARLLSVAERARHLFGSSSGQQPNRQARRGRRGLQTALFTEDEVSGSVGWSIDGQELSHAETTLDRLHQAMLLFASGRTDALKRFLVEDGIGLDGRFWRVAQSLSALYPVGTDEKRWVDGLLARRKSFNL